MRLISFFNFSSRGQSHAEAHLPLQNDDTIRPQAKSDLQSASTTSKGAAEGFVVMKKVAE